MDEGELKVEKLSRGMTWLDTTLDSLQLSSTFVLGKKTRVENWMSRRNCLENGIYK